MSSIIEGYNYDIFISYRQKDNKHDGWVTEFVDNLKGELESTFKEEISVYFDINLQDGLLETHDVDASLKDKLKCLVFIPIISRTYCDPRSFAWEHEFKAFVEQASQDKFGLKVKLPNGNVASRVLPIRIHDLDNDDIRLCESVLGGVLRGIEFIYKELGFNRPLKPDDKDNNNLNKTKYRNQIAKVALAVKDILLGLLTESGLTEKRDSQQRISFEEVFNEEEQIAREKPSSQKRFMLLLGFFIVAIIIVSSILIYPKIFKRDKLADIRSSDGRITVAVMPFRNLTNDTIWNVWQDGLQNNLINSLSNSEELKVKQIESITGLLQSKGLTNYASITPSIASTISQKLDANVLIYGSVNQVGNAIRVNAQLINSRTEATFKSFKIDGTSENILRIIDSLSIMVKNFLIISKMEKERSPVYKYYAFTNSPEAYKDYFYGLKSFEQGDFSTARNWYLQAINIDSNFINAILFLSLTYGNQGYTQDGKKWCLKAYAKRDQMSIENKLSTENLYALYFETQLEAIESMKQLLEIDDQVPTNLMFLGSLYLGTNQYDKAIPELEKALEIYKKWDSKPHTTDDYALLGIAYHKTGDYKKEEKLYKIAEQDFPADRYLKYRQAVLLLSEGDSVTAKKYLDSYVSICRDKLWSEPDIKTDLATIYSEADIFGKAEKYYRQALLSADSGSDNFLYLGNLAKFLIDHDRRIEEGLSLVNKALELHPDDYHLLDTKGWGLYKQGKYKDALEILQKSWELKTYYDHSVYLHIQKVKKAIANQKD